MPIDLTKYNKIDNITNPLPDGDHDVTIKSWVTETVKPKDLSKPEFKKLVYIVEDSEGQQALMKFSCTEQWYWLLKSLAEIFLTQEQMKVFDANMLIGKQLSVTVQNTQYGCEVKKFQKTLLSDRKDDIAF